MVSFIVKNVPLPRRIAGVGVMLAAGYFAKQQLKVFRKVQDMSNDAYIENHRYSRMLNSHGYLTDMEPMGKLASKWRNFCKIGPYGMFFRLKKIGKGIKEFTKDFILTPNLGWLAVAGAYMAGINAHKIVTGPVKTLWNFGVVQKIGKSVINFLSDASNFKWLKEPTEFLFTTKAGLLTTATALTLGYLFTEHIDRSHQRRLMQPFAKYP